MKIQEAAKITGVTVRTLQYYDKIGLLKPSHTTQAGYRIYEPSDLECLQQILFFRELEFSLSEIKEIMSAPSYNKREVLEKQKELLILKRNRLDGLIQLITETVEGEKTMSFKEFDNQKLEAMKNEYAKEVKERFGQTDAYKESKEKTKNYSCEDWNQVEAEANEIMKKFAEKKELPPESKEAQELVAQWQAFITEKYYTCTKEILSGLGIMYTQDERFKKNIDMHGEGTAEFMSEAIKVYCSK